MHFRKLLAVGCLLVAIQEAAGLDCCDIRNPVESKADNQTSFSFPYSRYSAPANASATCHPGYQCMPCVFDDQEFELTLKECNACSGSDTTQGICVPCLLGDWCPAGTVNKNGITTGAICPDGMVCEPSMAFEIVDRVKVEGAWVVNYDTRTCPEGHMCPAGTPRLDDQITNCQYYVDEFLSESFPNLDPADIQPSGYYCEQGTSGFKALSDDRRVHLQPCRSGNFCPNASNSQTCPDGAYCKKLVSEPVECPWSVDCQGEGNKKPGPSLPQAFMCFGIFLLLMAFLVFVRYQTALRSTRAKFQAREYNQDQLVRSTLADSIFKSTEMLELVGQRPEGFELIGLDETVNIQFHNLELVVKNKTLLQRVNGTFHSSRMVAVMGPSGCGKSTLLNTLCGKAYYGEQRGDIYINGAESPVQVLEPIMGFVPQDDTVYGNLTVYENIYFSAVLRLAAHTTYQEKLQRVDGTITALGLQIIKDSIVGTVEKRGISGGQKKRVNIGLEMATDPTVLFLDEPTSGLGASDTLIVMKGLHSLTRVRRTVIAVIHQPRYQVFLLFHDIMLLYPGGYTVYMGPSAMAEKWFSAIGFPTPEGENPADFFLDAISGLVHCARNPKFTAFNLTREWAEHIEAKSTSKMNSEKYLRTFLNVPEVDKTSKVEQVMKEAARKLKMYFQSSDEDGSGSLDEKEVINLLSDMGLKFDPNKVHEEFMAMDTNGNGKVEIDEFVAIFRNQLRDLMEMNAAPEKSALLNSSLKEATVNMDPDAKRDLSGLKRDKVMLPVQLWILLKRAFMQKIRQVDEIALHLFMLILSGFMVGVLLSSNHQPYEPDDPKLALMMVLIMAVMSTLSAVSSLKLFGHIKVMLVREASSGISVGAFFWSKCLLDIVENVWQPSFFLGVCYNFIIPRSTYPDMDVVLMLTSFAASGVGILLSVTVQPGNMTLVTVLVSLVLGIFVNGLIGVFYADIKDQGLAGIWSMSFSRWAGELLLVGELEASMDELYHRLFVQKSVLYYGYFPLWQTEREWYNSLPSGDEGKVQAQQDWDAYFDAYRARGYLALGLIGAILRIVAWAILTLLPRILRFAKELEEEVSKAFKERAGVLSSTNGEGDAQEVARTRSDTDVQNAKAVSSGNPAGCVGLGMASNRVHQMPLQTDTAADPSNEVHQLPTQTTSVAGEAAPIVAYQKQPRMVDQEDLDVYEVQEIDLLLSEQNTESQHQVTPLSAPTPQNDFLPISAHAPRSHGQPFGSLVADPLTPPSLSPESSLPEPDLGTNGIKGPHPVRAPNRRAGPKKDAFAVTPTRTAFSPGATG